jgi:hypothetical protein
MRPAKLALAWILLLATLPSSAQTLVERVFVMRTETTSVDPLAGMTHTCVLVYSDGRYRYERSFQGIRGGAPETKVYIDTLPDADLKSLQSIIDDSSFQVIKTAPLHGGIINDMDTLLVTIPREHGIQNINFENAAARKPFDKTLKPFQTLIKNVEKRKAPVSKEEKPNNCEAPRIMYRTIGVPGSTPDSN